MDKFNNSQKQSTEKDENNDPEVKKQPNMTQWQKSIQQEREKLPIFSFKDKVVQLVRENMFALITGETGSGKSTQLSQFMIDDLLLTDGTEIPSRVVITQPRRVAAIQMAKRVAYERGCDVGAEVGYTVRFDDRSSDAPRTTERHAGKGHRQVTRIKYVTDGILVRECLHDPNLQKYKVVILDEAHERSLNTDILFSLVKRACLNRKGDLRLIITSATLKTNKISEYYEKCPILSVSGRCYPVSILHNPTPKSDRLNVAIQTAIRIHLHEPEGDVLCFLTGFEECERAVKILNQKLQDLAQQKEVPPAIIVPLYGSQSPQQQANAFIKTPENCRKVVFATNIAETSLTVDNVGYVIDCGLVKQLQFDPDTGMDCLQMVNISKTQAIQRTGRAGRTREGKCIRLYSEQFYDESMPLQTVPEILRVNLTSTILSLKSLGINNITTFDFLDKPSQDQLERSLKNLFLIDALTSTGKLTDLGRELVSFPLEPSFAKAILYSCIIENILSKSRHFDREKDSVVDDMVTAVSVIASEGIWMNASRSDITAQQVQKDMMDKHFQDYGSDHYGLVKVYRAWNHERRNRSFHSLNQWCSSHLLQNRALQMAHNIKQQLWDCIDGVRMRRIESQLREDFAHIDLDREVLESSNKKLKSLKICLSLAFFMNVCKIVPGQSSSASRGSGSSQSNPTYLSIDPKGVLMTIDKQSILSQKHSTSAAPHWLVYTAASAPPQTTISAPDHNTSAASLGLIKQATAIRSSGHCSWIDHLIPKMSQFSIEKMERGDEKVTAGEAVVDKRVEKVSGSKRRFEEVVKSGRGEDFEEYQEGHKIEDNGHVQNQLSEKERKIAEMKERYLKRQKK